jgi:hypothetical protein
LAIAVPDALQVSIREARTTVVVEASAVVKGGRPRRAVLRLVLVDHHVALVVVAELRQPAKDLARVVRVADAAVVGDAKKATVFPPSPSSRRCPAVGQMRFARLLRCAGDTS